MAEGAATTSEGSATVAATAAAAGNGTAPSAAKEEPVRGDRGQAQGTQQAQGELQQQRNGGQPLRRSHGIRAPQLRISSIEERVARAKVSGSRRAVRRAVAASSKLSAIQKQLKEMEIEASSGRPPLALAAPAHLATRAGARQQKKQKSASSMPSRRWWPQPEVRAGHARPAPEAGGQRQGGQGRRELPPPTLARMAESSGRPPARLPRGECRRSASARPRWRRSTPSGASCAWTPSGASRCSPPRPTRRLLCR